jgi:hypothetical protein
MPAISFFPWLDCAQEVRIGPIRLVPYARRKEPGSSPLVSQNILDAVLRAYADPPRRRIRSATLLEVDDWTLGQELDEHSQQRLFRAREAICFSALAERRLFSTMGYCNSDNFYFVVQNFSSTHPEGFAYLTRRRDGGTSNYWSSDEFAFICPGHVHRERTRIDDQVAVFLMATDNDAWLGAIAEFNAANTDAPGVAPYTEMIMIKSAFERLLGINDQKNSFREALQKAFSLEPRSAGGGELGSRWTSRWPHATDLLDAWASEFHAQRGIAAHGNAQDKGAFVWSEPAHLAFASLLFPLALKAVAHEAGCFSLTSKDRARMAALNGFISYDPFKPMASVVERADHPWRKIENNVDLAQIAYRLYPDWPSVNE